MISGTQGQRAARLPEGHPQRTAQINRHIGGLTSGVGRAVNKATAGLASMNLSAAEHRYVHIETQKRQAARAGAASLRNAEKYGYNPKNTPQATSYKGPGKPFKGPKPLTPVLGASPAQLAHLDRTEHRLRGIKKGLDKQNAEYAAILNPISHQNLAFAGNQLWQDTGIPAIRNAGKDPVGAGLAVAGLLPFGKVAELGGLARGADEAARAAKLAKAVKTAEEGRGLRKVVASRRALKLMRKGAPRTEEQAAQHVTAVAKRARQQGFGRLLPKTPELKPGETSPETGGNAGLVIRKGLHPDLSGLGKYETVGAKLDNPGIAALRKEQEAARGAERSSRAGAIERAAADKTGLARHIAARAALEGKLPAKIFRGFSSLTPELRDSAINHIYEHPHLQPYEKVRTAEALDEAIAGKVPTVGDQKLLERAFGKETATGLRAAIGGRTFTQKLADVLNVPRALMASGDVSAPFRQGLVVAASHPRLFFRELVPMLKYLKSEDTFQGLQQAIHTDPAYSLAEKGKLALTDIGETAKTGAANLSKREEQFTSNLAERLPGIGHVVRASDRAYVGFLNATRFKLFKLLLHQAAGEGYHLNDKLVEDIAKFVNSATGRGDIGKLADHTATLNALFFSPRLLASRLNFLNPTYYARMEPFARARALRAAVRLGGTLSTVLYVAKLAGAQVGTDPRNADFGKIRVGNTRIDIAGGFQQPLRLLAELGSGQIVSSTSGRLEHLSGGFAGSSRFDVALQFAEGKLAPVPGSVVDVLKNQQFNGDPLDFSPNPLDTNSEIVGHLMPLAWQDAIGTYQQTHSLPAGIGGGVLSATGVGVQSYSGQKANSPDKVKAETAKSLARLNKQMDVLHVPANYRQVYARGTRVEVLRDLAKRQARKMSKNGKISEAVSYRITMQTLRKAGMMSPTQYRQAVVAVPRMNERELKHWEYEAWYHLGPGKLLEQFHHYYNVKTGTG